MIGTFAWLILTTARNRALARLRRLRNPRYAVAMLIGVTYIWAVYIRPAHGRPRAEELLGPALAALLPLLTLAFVAWIWIVGGEQGALAFTEAEVSLLFTAPVTRRTLVVYRIARTQVAILTTSIVWTLLFQQAPSLPVALRHVLSYWVMLATLNLNRLGVALVHAGAREHGLRSARRNWIPAAVFAAILAMVVVPVVRAWPQVREAGGITAAAEVVAAALLVPPARWALSPFHLVVAPIAAANGRAWLAAMGPALLLLAILFLWVLRSESAFEETAAEASAAQARRIEARRARRGAEPLSARHVSRTIPLAPTGAPAVALLWKNAMWLLRANEIRGLLAPPVAALIAVGIVSPRNEIAAVMIAAVCGLIAVGMLLVGPLSTRNDLRTELLHLGLLKTFPLRGRDVVLAEVASGAIPIAVVQYLLGIAALLSLAFVSDAGFPPGVRVAAVVGAPLLLFGLNGATFIIHNGIALLFPGWVRLGGRGGGVENLGFGMITLAFVTFTLAVLLVLPAGIAALLVALLRARLGLAVLVAALAAAVVLLAEVVACAWALGGSLDRVEPMAVEG